MSGRVETIGLATLYLGDCREIAPTLPRPDAVVSDPPYGQRHKVNVLRAGRTRRYTLGGTANSGAGEAQEWPDIIGDDEPFDPTPWLGAADIVLLWGAHRFADRLPAGSWLLWDKVPTGKVRDQGDGEAAWLNAFPPRPLRIFRLLWDGVCVGPAARHEVTAGQQRVHPTQKPEALMAWCIEQARVPAGGTIMDPYMGAGSTGVAAVRAGHPFVGCEIVPRYFDTACRRIEAAQRQGDMFLGSEVAADAR